MPETQHAGRGALSWGRPWMLALVIYMLTGAALLAPSIRPGRTVVPVDILQVVEPFHSVEHLAEVHEPAPSDSPLQFLGWWSWTARELRTGHVPEWNPDVLGGVPVEPNGFVSTAYPFTYLDRVLAPFDAYNAFVWAHLVIAAMGAYALARRLGARAGPAIVGGLGAFGVAFLVHLSTHLTHLAGIAWAGLTLAGVHYVVTERRRRGVVAVAVPLAFAWLGGGTQFAYFLSLAAAAYGFLLAIATGGGARGVATRLVRLGGGMALGVGLAAPLLVPTLKAGNDILRSKEPAASTVTTHLPKKDVLRVVLPAWRHPDGFDWGQKENLEYEVDSPFVGVVTGVLAIGAIFVARRRRDVVITAVAAAGVAFLAWDGPIHRILHAGLPGYDHFRVSARWISLLGAFVVPLAGVGLDALLRQTRAVRTAIAAGATAVVATCGLFLLAGVVRPHVPARALASDALFVVALCLVLLALVALRPRLAPGVVLGTVAVLLLVEAAAHTTTWYGAHREADALPPLPAIARAAGAGGRIIRLSPALTQLPPLPADVPLAYGWSDASAWAVFFPRDADAYLNLVEPSGHFAALTNVAPPLTHAASLTSPLLDALDVRTVLVDPGVSEPLPYPVVGNVGPVRVLRRPSIGPAVVVTTASPAASLAATRRAIADPSWDPVATSSVVGLPQVLHGGGTAVRTGSTADTERYRVMATSASVLRVSGRYDRGWGARIDGHPTKVYEADGLFRSVVVPKGQHVVTWRYVNPASRTGRKVGAVSVLVGLALLALDRRRERPRITSPGAVRH